MEKLNMQTHNLAEDKFKKLQELFPNAVTEVMNENGETEKAIDKDVLMQEISSKVVEGREERYQFTWPDKKQSILAANAPISKTLRPCRDESKNFDTTENLYIEGDNLEVLKLLQETYLGKIKMIYIDPPYNTGSNLIYKNDFKILEDDYSENSGQFDQQGNQLFENPESNGRFHTDWLNMMYGRLKIARNLLSDDGVIVIAIDHYEISNVIKICDEIYGEKNRLGVVTVVHKPEGRNQEKFFGTSNEFAIFYSKDKKIAKFNQIAISEEVKKTFNETDDRGRYRLNNYRRDGGGDVNLRVNKKNFWYPIFYNEKNDDISLMFIEGYIEILPITNTGVERTWKTNKETFRERLNKQLIKVKKENGRYQVFEKYYEQQVIKTHWIEKKYHAIHYGTSIIESLLGKSYFDFPKSLYLIEDILRLVSNKDCTVLDLFSGSATTAHAVMQLNAEDGGNRKFIMVQLPEQTDEKSEAYKAGYKNICEIGKERIRRAGEKILEENKDKGNIDKLDVGFRVLKTDSSNMKDVYYTPENTEQSFLDNLEDNIKEDRTQEDLLFQVMLDLGVPLSSNIEVEQIEDAKVFKVEDRFLVACFDGSISDEVVKQIADMKPFYAVFRDMSMKNDSVAVNFEQIFESISPKTIRKVL